MLDFDQLDLGEMEVICDVMGITDITKFGDIIEKEGLSPKLVATLVWIEKSREDPSFTMADAKKVKFNEAMAMFTDPNDDGAESASPSESVAVLAASSADTSQPSARPTDTPLTSSIA